MLVRCRHVLASQRRLHFRSQVTTSRSQGVQATLNYEASVNPRKNRPRLAQNSIWVSWSPAFGLSLIHMLSVVRFVERHFGKVRNFAVIRDADIPTKYIKWIYVWFSSPDTMHRVPSEETTYEIPIEQTEKPDLVGLNEVVSLVAPYNGPIRQYAPPILFSTAEMMTEQPNTQILAVLVRRSTLTSTHRTPPLTVEKTF